MFSTLTIIVSHSPVKQLCRLALDMGGGVRSCDLTGRLAVVLLVSGSLALVELVEGGGGEEGEASFSIAWPDIDKVLTLEVNKLSLATPHSNGP